MIDLNKLADEIQDAAYEVRKHLCPGYLEEVYKQALKVELQNRGFDVKMEVPIKVYYKGYNVKDYFADLLVEDRIIIEAKAVSTLLPAHEAQLVNYLTATGLDHGLLINFGGEKFQCRHKTREYNK